ncbi:MAG: oxygen-independent coproporphyrinogen III oxidase [Burkholderiales bacterium]|nr:oxygen-independent coproporphyrinogen III oxidase [Burkholderiales bacterium]
MNAPAIDFDPDLVRRLDRQGPRYTSYPTADRFVEAFDAATYRAWTARRNPGGLDRGLALYVHLPFCSDVCFYCACNKIITRDRARGARYLDYLGREIALQGALFGEDRRVGEMHWGGGTPTWHGVHELAALWRRVGEHFELEAGGEYSIEVDPRTVTPESVAALRAIGFNRVSFGVQDFDPEVQAAVHRVQSEEATLATIEAARAAGFVSVNVDLIYGLPRQTLMSFNRTLARVTAARPDRVALYNYAHLPAQFKPQRRIAQADLPHAETKLKLLALAVERLGAAGYAYIGMDHFALPHDALAVAQRHRRLRRNFQGYTACADRDLVGLGVSAIGGIGPTYSQNFRTLEKYYGRLDGSELPVMRGVELGADDLVRRAVIQELMCHFTLCLESISLAYLIDFERYFAAELKELRELETLGLVSLEPGWLSVTPRGRFLVRRVCMVFDRYLARGADGGRFSRVI